MSKNCVLTLAALAFLVAAPPWQATAWETRRDTTPPSPAPDMKDPLTSEQCRVWLRETYQVASLADAFELDFDERIVESAACVDRDLGLMPPSIPRGWCDNVFKVHCAGVDLLAEIGEVIVERCATALSSSLGVDVGRDRSWNVCAEPRVFDAYALQGVVSDAAGCRRILIEDCGADFAGSEAAQDAADPPADPPADP